jgi:hypothetical protein
VYKSSAVQVPPGALPAFAEAWAEDISRGNCDLCLHEALPDEYSFFATAQLPEDVADLDQLVSSLSRILESFVLNDPACLRVCNVAMAPLVNGTRLVRLVWPSFIVNTTQALTMRERLVAEMSAQDMQDDRVGDLRWHDILDYTAYTGDGPVLPGSGAILPCSHCRNSRNARECEYCNGNGVVQSVQVMVPHLSYDQGVSTPLSKADGSFSGEHILAMSVQRMSGPGVQWSRPPGTPFFSSERRDPLAAPKVYPTGSVHDFGTGVRRKPPTPVSIPTLKLLQKAIRTLYPTHHSMVIVTAQSVFHDPVHSKYIVSPLGVGCHTCCKFKGEHSDSRVYFVVTIAGVAQGCHSKEKLPGGGECKSKTSAPVPMNRQMVECLFPGTRANNISSLSNGRALGPAYHIALRVIDHHASKVFTSKRTKRPFRNLYGD